MMSLRVELKTLDTEAPLLSGKGQASSHWSWLMIGKWFYSKITRFWASNSDCKLSTLKQHQGSQIRQNYCSDDSTEVTEGVTSNPEIFNNKQGATSTPEIFGNKHSFALTSFATIQLTLIVNVVNLN